MERYGYSYRVSSTYTAPQASEYWGKPSYDSDHVRRPVIVDADARNRPIVPSTPQNIDSYGNRPETNFQDSHRPLESESRHGLHAYPDSRVEYPVAEEKWHKNPASDYDQPREVEEFITKVQTEASRLRFSPSNATHWRSSPEKPTGFNSSNGGYGDRNDFSNKDWQTSPKSTGLNINNGRYGDRNDLSNKDWLQTSPISSGFNKNNGGYGDRNDFSNKDWLQTSTKSPAFNSSNGGFNERNDFSNKDWLKPGANADRNDSYEDYLRKPTSTRPHHVSWAKPAENSLSSPTNDITTALGYLIETAKPAVSHITTATGDGPHTQQQQQDLPSLTLLNIPRTQNLSTQKQLTSRILRSDMAGIIFHPSPTQLEYKHTETFTEARRSCMAQKCETELQGKCSSIRHSFQACKMNP